MGQILDVAFQWLATNETAALALAGAAVAVIALLIALALIARAKDSQIVESLPDETLVPTPAPAAIAPKPKPLLQPQPVTVPEISSPAVAEPGLPPRETLQASPGAALSAPPHRTALVIEPLGVPSGGIAEASFARSLSTHLALVLSRLAPQIDVARELVAGTKLSEAPIMNDAPHYRLGGSVRRVSDRMHVQLRLVDRRSGAEIFGLECEGGPDEEDRILAEVAQRILKHAA